MCQNVLHWVATIEQWHRNLTAPAIQEYDRAAAAAQIQFGAELALQIQARDSADQVKLLARQNASLKRKLELVALCAVVLAFPRGRRLLPPHGIYMEAGKGSPAAKTKRKTETHKTKESRVLPPARSLLSVDVPVSSYVAEPPNPIALSLLARWPLSTLTRLLGGRPTAYTSEMAN
ncbi:hypothetical protein FIBSPDRAFT_1041475 [Athelia psychrophila]|uniref:Uncharacterized protein n=1 Tax=Athelia psychrophila TaxID=1759441 RepID=A0A166NS72_9AGAM|nr:hypothetical protein FIBSPDRAFT_1041475 [Fibularhizoctonia sp. CBS 109695]